MNTNIKNPARHSKQTLRRDGRRHRPDYPSLKSREGKIMDRPECGTNSPIMTDVNGAVSRILRGQFIFLREPAPISRSKYTPHVGNKQDAKLCAKVAKEAK